MATQAAKIPLIGTVAAIAVSMGNLLDPRIGFRLPIVLAGAMLAGSRRTASRWFQAAGVKDDWDRFYDLLMSVGKQVGVLVSPLCRYLVQRFDPGPDGRWTFAIDDSPTKRFGRHVEGANTHHNPTPGPADGEWLYGHNWVCLAVLLPHPLWGVLALPLLSALYVRRVDVAKLNAKHGWTFHTKHELAVQLIRRATACLRALGSVAAITVVADGAYAAGSMIRMLMQDGVTVVSRLRRDALLFDLPPAPTGRRGRPRKYGKNRISLSKRAKRRDGWTAVTFLCRGVETTRQCKSFRATSKLVGGGIRVVLVEHNDGNWAAYFSTDVAMDVRSILETVADRWAIEEFFHDVKEVWGAGQQQVRNLWSNIGCWNLNSWLYAMVELASWDAPADQLVDRSDRGWDNPDRRPSHADRRRQISRKMMENQFLADLPDTAETAIYRERILTLLHLAA
jgi:hypothetical protein